ncbi:MAG: GNAT family N-acetyltransferase [Piscinibacter sp.]|nr:GNAT family N-acetyltransferase [Piscinibacter sp.]
MNLKVEWVDGASAPERFGDAWSGLVGRHSAPPGGLDATAGPVWFAALSEAFGTAARSGVVVLRDGEAVAGLLPLVRESGRACRRLMAPTVLYGGRNGFVLDRPDADRLHALLCGVREAFGAWQSIRMVLVDGGETDILLREAAARHGYGLIHDEGEASPYFPLLDDEAAFSAKMSKGLKQTLRTATNKFKALGPLDLRPFGAESDVDWALESILAIDRASWKQEAGTAITCHPEQERFYRALFPLAARAGLLYGQIAMLAGRPIAFNFGLVHAGVFCCLKHSQTLEHQALSPGQIVNADMIGALRARGVATFDFMGKVEPHKMRWSDANGLYTRRQVWIYAPTICGRIGHLLHRVRRWLRQSLRPAPTGTTGTTNPDPA